MSEPDQAVEGDLVESADPDERDLAPAAGRLLATAETDSESGAPEADDGWIPV